MLRRFALFALALTSCAHAPAAPGSSPLPLVLGADLHAHLVMAASAHPLFRGRPGEPGPRAESPGDLVDNQIDLAELQRAGIRVVIASVWPAPALSPWRTSLDEALEGLRALRRWALRHPEVVLATDAEAALRATGAGKIALIPAVEGGEGITRASDVDRIYAAGACSMQLTHFADNDVAGAAATQVGKALFAIRSEASNDRGLSPLGRAVVERMIALGMIIDVAHCSDRSANEAMDLAAAARAPIVDSHSGARALSAGERNISDSLAARIAGNGGLVGVTLYSHFVANVPQGARFPNFTEDTCDDVIAHWLYLAKQIGPDSLALGSDFNGFILRSPAGGGCPNGIRGTQDLPDFFAALSKAGFPREALDHTGAHLLELWKHDELAGDADAIARARRADREPDFER